MDYNRVISFILNNNLLSENCFFIDDVKISKTLNSNINYSVEVNKKTADSNNNSLFIKIKNDTDTPINTLLLREYFFYDFFNKPSLNIFGFSEFPKLRGKGIFQNNAVLVREFVMGYSSAERQFLISADLTNEIKSIGAKLRMFHEAVPKSRLRNLKHKFGLKFKPSEIYKNPIAFSEIPPINKFKFSPFFIQEFWKILNNEIYRGKLNKIFREVFASWKRDKIIHGDFRLANILFAKKGENDFDTGKYLFIDFELWHLGDIKWDIACFIYDLEIFFKRNNIDCKDNLLEIFLEGYQENFPPIPDPKDKSSKTLILLKLQNLYFELNEDNFTEKLETLNDILNELPESYEKNIRNRFN